MKNGTVLVTGGSRGIGRAIVARLIEDGYEAVNFSRGAPESLLPGETFRSVDLADARAAGEAARELAASRPVLHLVNNAGMIEVAGIEAVTQDALARTMAVNLVAPVVLLQALLPGMRAARHGRVVNIGSRAALGKPAHGLWRVQGRAGGHDADLGAGTGGRRHHGEHRGAGAGGDGTVQRVESPAIRARARWRPRSRWAAAACRKRWRTWWPCSWTGAPPS